MGQESKIQWTDATWNPVTGCDKISSGCKFCYAETVANRFWGVRKFTDVLLHPERLADPLKWRKPKMVFVNSMSDLFHEDVPDEFIDWVFAVMASRGIHTFQVLTKRPQRMLDYLKSVTERSVSASKDYEGRIRAHFEKYKREFLEGYSLPDPPTPELRVLYDSACLQENRLLVPDGTTLWNKGFSGGEYHWRKWPLHNVWLGVSVEDQKTADERIPLLLQCPAAVRFVSYEPALEAVDFFGPNFSGAEITQVTQRIPAIDYPDDPALSFKKLKPNWIIVGGESGSGARPFNIEWARNVIEQCKAAGVACFVKQLGAKPFMDGSGGERFDWPCGFGVGDGITKLLLKDKKGGEISEWPADIRVRDFPAPVEGGMGEKEGKE